MDPRIHTKMSWIRNTGDAVPQHWPYQYCRIRNTVIYFERNISRAHYLVKKKQIWRVVDLVKDLSYLQQGFFQLFPQR